MNTAQMRQFTDFLTKEARKRIEEAERDLGKAETELKERKLALKACLEIRSQL